MGSDDLGTSRDDSQGALISDQMATESVAQPRYDPAL